MIFLKNLSNTNSNIRDLVLGDHSERVQKEAFKYIRIVKESFTHVNKTKIKKNIRFKSYFIHKFGYLTPYNK
jgi:hypothetical protein